MVYSGTGQRRTCGRKQRDVQANNKLRGRSLRCCAHRLHCAHALAHYRRCIFLHTHAGFTPPALTHPPPHTTRRLHVLCLPHPLHTFYTPRLHAILHLPLTAPLVRHARDNMLAPMRPAYCLTLDAILTHSRTPFTRLPSGCTFASTRTTRTRCATTSTCENARTHIPTAYNANTRTAGI